MHPERVLEGWLQSCLREQKGSVSSVSRGRAWGVTHCSVLPGRVGVWGASISLSAPPVLTVWGRCLVVFVAWTRSGHFLINITICHEN